jgi:hypothetical protein
VAKQKSVDVANHQTRASKAKPRSARLSERGVETGAQFASLMSALMSDIISGRVTPAVGNAACNAGGKLLKVVEMQYKYGTQSGNQGERTLLLAPTQA